MHWNWFHRLQNLHKKLNNMKLKSVNEHFKEWYKKQRLFSKLIFKYWYYFYYIQIKIYFLYIKLIKGKYDKERRNK